MPPPSVIDAPVPPVPIDRRGSAPRPAATPSAAATRMPFTMPFIIFSLLESVTRMIRPARSTALRESPRAAGRVDRYNPGVHSLLRSGGLPSRQPARTDRMYAPVPRSRRRDALPPRRPCPLRADRLMEIAILLALIVLNGLLAMAEIALVTARKARLQKQVDDGDRLAQPRSLSARTRTVSCRRSRSGSRRSASLNGIFGEAALAAPFAEWLEAWAFARPGRATRPLRWWSSSSPTVSIGGELSPSSSARSTRRASRGWSRIR